MERPIRSRDIEVTEARPECEPTPAFLLFTGLSAAGKSTLAEAVRYRLLAVGRACVLLDGDRLRAERSADLGFSAADRSEQLRRAGEWGLELMADGHVVLAAFIAPYRADRERLRARIGAARFLEVHCHCPLPTCEARDPKGLYRRARAGELHDFTGISAPYESPLQPDLRLRTDLLSPEHAAEQVIRLMQGRRLRTPEMS